jgi:hypothetical protein
MDDTGRFQVKRGIVFREDDEGAFLFDPDTDNLKYLNETAKETFLLLEKRGSLNRVIQGLCDNYPGIERARIQRDIVSFIVQLEANGFITAITG